HGHIDAGLAAFQKGDWQNAADEYRQASRDLDRLGRRDPESLRIRQRSRELTTIVNLATTSLYDICDVARPAVSGGADAWKRQFDQLYRGQWIVVEGEIVQGAGPGGTTQAIVRYPFPIDGAPVIVNADLKALTPLTIDAKPRKAIFAGQLESLNREGTTKSP